MSTQIRSFKPIATISWRRAYEYAFVAIMVTLTLILIGALIHSLNWRMDNDAPVMLYYGFLVDRLSMVPYRDYFDINAPGAILLEAALGHIFGYTDIGYRVSDLIVLGAISMVTWMWLRRINWRAAWFAVVIFAWTYLCTGPILNMEREYLLVLPIALTGLVATTTRMPRATRWFLVGFISGIAATVKPHAAVVLPIIVIYLLLERHAEDRNTRIFTLDNLYLGGIMGLGFAIPILTILAYLVATGAFPYFLDIVLNMLPLYSQIGFLSNLFVLESPAQRLLWRLWGLIHFGGLQTFMMMAFSAAIFSLTRPYFSKRYQRQVWLLISLAITYGLYPVIQGQFLPYHYFLFLYFLILVIAICAIEFTQTCPVELSLPTGLKFLNNVVFTRSFALALVIATVAVAGFSPASIAYMLTSAQNKPKAGIPDRIASYMREHMQPGDTLLNTDYRAGGVHALLMLEAKPATRYLSDWQFYTFVSTPYIQHLRQTYINELTSAKPRFVIQVTGKYKIWVEGYDTTHEFPEFTAFINTYYEVVYQEESFQILELNKTSVSPTHKST